MKENIEIKIGENIGNLLYKQMRENKKNISVKIDEDRIIILMPHALSDAEKYLMQNSKYPNTESLMHLKEKLFKDLRSALENIIYKLTGVKVTNTHSSINIDTGERVLIFSLYDNLEQKNEKK